MKHDRGEGNEPWASRCRSSNMKRRHSHSDSSLFFSSKTKSSPVLSHFEDFPLLSNSPLRLYFHILLSYSIPIPKALRKRWWE